MEETGLSQLSDEVSVPELSALPTTQDIPEAVREASTAGKVASGKSASKLKPLLLVLGGLGVVALMGVPLVLAFRPSVPGLEARSGANGSVDEAVDGSVPNPSQTAAPTDPVEEALLGHLLYEEAPKAELAPITPDGSLMMRRAAAEKFNQMVDAAAADGVSLMPLSGFRSVSEQESIFFDVKAERGEVAAKRAAVSAPPGYSEHHTGYAVDIGDGNHPGTDLQFDFEDTGAFQWLQKNAAYYSFEMSFPKDNSLDVSYEPWHWRFVGDRESLETFYRAKNRTEQPTQAATSTTQESTPLSEEAEPDQAQ